jgi:hypothetical protein
MTIKTDSGTYPENPKVLQLPAAGEKYIDDLAGAEVLRFTDERDGNGNSLSTTYSVWPTFNCDNTRIWIFQVNGSYYVGNLNPVTLERVGPLEEVVPARIGDNAGAFVDNETAFWSYLDPDKIFVLVDCQIWSYKPSTKQHSVIADLRSQFPAGARFNQLYVSQNDNRFAAIVRSGSSGSGDYGFMVYEKSSNSVKLKVTMGEINGIQMGKEGRYVLLVQTDEAGGKNKNFIYDVDTGAVEILLSDSNGKPDYCIGHTDAGYDFITGGDHWRGALTARKLSTPHDVIMVWLYSPMGWINFHISHRCDNDSWATLSTYGGSLRYDPARDAVINFPDGPFVREIFQVGVKAPFLGQVRRLVHARSNWTGAFYWTTPRATGSRGGRFLAWTHNNNGDAATARTDVYVARIEPAPSEGTVPSPPAPTPAPTPTPTPTAPPIATITFPTDGAILSGKASVTAAITNAEGIGDVFLVADETVVGMDVTAPYEFQLDTTQMQDGPHSLWIRAWQAGKAVDSARMRVTVKNVAAPPVEPPPLPPPPPTIPCSISAPASVNILRNSTGVIGIELLNLTAATEVRVIVPDGQVTVSPTSWNANPNDRKKQFNVRVKKQSREIKFQSGCGVAVVKVNVT